jgi:hypothetical protein
MGTAHQEGGQSVSRQLANVIYGGTPTECRFLSVTAERNDVSAKLLNECRRRWPRSKCAKDTVSVADFKTKVDGSREIIEIYHLHYSYPHLRYYRLIARDGKISETCDTQAMIPRP